MSNMYITGVGEATRKVNLDKEDCVELYFRNAELAEAIADGRKLIIDFKKVKELAKLKLGYSCRI